MGFVPIHPAASERDRLVPRKSLERSHRVQGTVPTPSAPLARPTAPRRSLGQHEGARPHRTSDPPRRSRAHHRARTRPSAVHDPAASSQGRPAASSEQHGAPDSHSEPLAAEYPVRTRASRRWSAACCARSSMTLFRSQRRTPVRAREAGDTDRWPVSVAPVMQRRTMEGRGVASPGAPAARHISRGRRGGLG